MADANNLEMELRQKLVERLHLEHIAPESFTSATPLFKDGLELDSLDALEITVMIEEEYGIVIGVAERTGAVFGTLRDLASFVHKNRDRDRAKL